MIERLAISFAKISFRRFLCAASLLLLYAQAAIAQAGCAPEECFFADDMEPYVEGARRAGIDAVQFESLPQLQRELRSRGA